MRDTTIVTVKCNTKLRMRDAYVTVESSTKKDSRDTTNITVQYDKKLTKRRIRT